MKNGKISTCITLISAKISAAGFLFFSTLIKMAAAEKDTSQAASPTLAVTGRFRYSLHDNKILFEIGRLFFSLNIILCQLNLIRIPPGIQLPSLITFHALLKPIC